LLLKIQVLQLITVSLSQPLLLLFLILLGFLLIFLFVVLVEILELFLDLELFIDYQLGAPRAIGIRTNDSLCERGRLSQWALWPLRTRTVPDFIKNVGDWRLTHVPSFNRVYRLQLGFGPRRPADSSPCSRLDHFVLRLHADLCAMWATGRWIVAILKVEHSLYNTFMHRFSRINLSPETRLGPGVRRPSALFAELLAIFDRLSVFALQLREFCAHLVPKLLADEIGI
jgi:hypothetical protein